MFCFRTRPRARAHFTVALLGTVTLYACDDRSIESPTEPLAQPADALLKDASKRALIAFSSDRDGGNSEIYVMNADGRKQARLTNNTDFDLSPAWSPDRTKIAYQLPQWRDRWQYLRDECRWNRPGPAHQRSEF